MWPFYRNTNWIESVVDSSRKCVEELEAHERRTRELIRESQRLIEETRALTNELQRSKSTYGPEENGASSSGQGRGG